MDEFCRLHMYMCTPYVHTVQVHVRPGGGSMYGYEYAHMYICIVSTVHMYIKLEGKEKKNKINHEK